MGCLTFLAYARRKPHARASIDPDRARKVAPADSPEATRSPHYAREEMLEEALVSSVATPQPWAPHVAVW